MPIENLDPVLDITHRFSKAWAEREGVPLPDTRTAQCELEWRRTPRGSREQLIGTAMSIADWRERTDTLFVLWLWEPESDLRALIVRAFPLERVAEINRVLRKIYRNETPGEDGAAVRMEVKNILLQRAAGEPGAEPVRTRGAARARGVVPGGGLSAREVLAEIEEIQATELRPHGTQKGHASAEGKN